MSYTLYWSARIVPKSVLYPELYIISKSAIVQYRDQRLRVSKSVSTRPYLRAARTASLLLRLESGEGTRVAAEASARAAVPLYILSYKGGWVSIQYIAV